MVWTMKNRKDAVKDVYEELNVKGHQHKLDVLNNKYSRPAKIYIIT